MMLQVSVLHVYTSFCSVTTFSMHNVVTLELKFAVYTTEVLPNYFLETF